MNPVTTLDQAQLLCRAHLAIHEHDPKRCVLTPQTTFNGLAYRCSQHKSFLVLIDQSELERTDPESVQP